MTEHEDAFDALIASSLRGGMRTCPADEAFIARLNRETRPFAAIRNHPRCWALIGGLFAFSLCSVASLIGFLPIPGLTAASSAPVVVADVIPARTAPEGVVEVPVVDSGKPRVVRRARQEVRDDLDRAIVNALDFIASSQNKDGSFPHQYGNSAAISSLAGMAFLSHGHLADDKRYGETIRRCLDFVFTTADMRDNYPYKGYMGGRGDGKMYAHSIAALFLSECSGMVDAVRQKKIDEILPYAVKVIIDAQNQSKGDNDVGGWRYQPNSSDSDLSCSGWALMALKSARQNGAQVPDEAIEKAVLYIKRNYRESDGTFGYQGANGGSADTLSGAAILCLELCGRHLDPAAIKASKYLKGRYRQVLGSNSGNVFYGLYYTSQGLFQIGGEVWKEFEPWMNETYLKLQNQDGSWRGNEVNNPVYTTSMTVLALTVPYRMLPIYQRDETVDY